MKIIFGYKLLSFVVKISNLDVWLVPKDASNKHFLCLLVNILHSETKHVNKASPVGLSLFFQKAWIGRQVGKEWASYNKE